MNAVEWADERSRGLSVWDTGILKIYCTLFGAVVGAYASAFIREHVMWFAAAVVLLGGYFAYRWVTSPGPRDRETPK